MPAELEKTPRLLLIRLRSLGDSILTLPLIDALKVWRQSLQIDVLVEASFAPVFSGHPAVREALILSPRSEAGGPGWSKWRTLAEIRKRRYAVVVDLHGGSTSFLFAIASGAPLRVGQESYRRRWGYNALVPPSAQVWGREPLHTVEHQLSLLRCMGIPEARAPRPTLQVRPRQIDRVRRRLIAAGINPHQFAHIHPTATLFTKQWPAERFAALADAVSERHGIPVVFTCGNSEARTLVEAGTAARRQHTYWSDLDLEELFALIAQCRIFAGNDSGPMHAAAALGRPVCVVWGSSNFRAWHPWGTDFEAVRSELPCMPCAGYQCEAYGEPKCILDIPVERVLDAWERLLARSPAASQ